MGLELGLITYALSITQVMLRIFCELGVRRVEKEAAEFQQEDCADCRRRVQRLSGNQRRRSPPFVVWCFSCHTLGGHSELHWTSQVLDEGLYDNHTFAIFVKALQQRYELFVVQLIVHLYLLLRCTLVISFRVAVDMNVLGVRRALDVCKQLPHIEVSLASVTWLERPNYSLKEKYTGTSAPNLISCSTT